MSMKWTHYLDATKEELVNKSLVPWFESTSSCVSQKPFIRWFLRGM